MILKKIKIKIFYKNILIFLSFALLFFSFLFSYFKFEKVKKIEKEISEIYKKGKDSTTIRSLKKEFFLKFLKKDPYFIDKHLKSFTFRRKEIKNLEKLLLEPAFIESTLLKERLNFLKGEKNKLFFKQQSIKSNLFLKETQEIQKREIEIDEEDIKRILSFFENVKISNHLPFKNSPHMIIKRFSYLRDDKTLKLKNLSIIKRDFYEN
jgi:hypothetical protein